MILLASSLTPTQLGLESIHTGIVVNHLLWIPAADLNSPVDVIEGVGRHSRVAIGIALAPAMCPHGFGTVIGTINVVARVDAVLVTTFFVRARHGPIGALPEGFGAFDRFPGCCLTLGVDVVKDFLVVVLRAAVEVVEFEAH